jgi:ABC-2 type transport system permease protein
VTALWLATPFPALMQAPLDVLVERGGGGHAVVLIAGQLAWLAVLLALGRLVQRNALRRLVIQGG